MKESSPVAKPAMGLWRCWSLLVGTMVGSGVFLLPAVLAPCGGVGFLGWAVVAIASFAYAFFAIPGSGLEVIGWGLVMMAIGVPVYVVARRCAGVLPQAAVMPADG